jgi:hypothetical protein
MCDTGGTLSVAVGDVSFSSASPKMINVAIRDIVALCRRPDTVLNITRLATNQQQLEEAFDPDTEHFIAPTARRVGQEPSNSPYYSFYGVVESPGGEYCCSFSCLHVYHLCANLCVFW